MFKTHKLHNALKPHILTSGNPCGVLFILLQRRVDVSLKREELTF